MQARPDIGLPTKEDVDVSGSGNVVGLNRGLALTWEGKWHLGVLQGAGVKAVQPASQPRQEVG